MAETLESFTLRLSRASIDCTFTDWRKALLGSIIGPRFIVSIMIRQSLMAVVGRLGPEVDGLGFFAVLNHEN